MFASIRRNLRHPFGGRGASRRRKVAGGAVIASLVIPATALGFFLAEGSGSAHENLQVGTTTTQNLNVSLSDNHAGLQILPCGTDASSTFGAGCSGNFQETSVMAADPANGNPAKVQTVTASVKASSLPVGCQASWWLVQNEPSGLPITLQPGAAAQTLVVVEVGLENMPTVDQGACEGATPELDIAVS